MLSRRGLARERDSSRDGQRSGLRLHHTLRDLRDSVRGSLENQETFARLRQRMNAAPPASNAAAAHGLVLIFVAR